ncbi:hypothetical protein C8J56DRAFT_1040417 [Mycena floridula]|nr:hypothetical protein C8J56DRAFT_1040417 [Mycena floridula]
MAKSKKNVSKSVTQFNGAKLAFLEGWAKEFFEALDRAVFWEKFLAAWTKEFPQPPPALSEKDKDADETTRIDALRAQQLETEALAKAEEKHIGDWFESLEQSEQKRHGNPSNFDEKGVKGKFLEHWAKDFCETRDKKGFYAKFFPLWLKEFPNLDFPALSPEVEGDEAAKAEATKKLEDERTSARQLEQKDKYAPKVAATFKDKWGVPEGKIENDLALTRRVAVAKELLEAEGEETKKEVTTERDKQYEEDVEAHKTFLKAFHMDSDTIGDGVQFSNELRQECCYNLAAVAQPLLNALHCLTGEHIVMLSGSPPKSADQGEKWSLMALHAGRTPVTKRTFIEWNKGIFRDGFMLAFMGFLWCVGDGGGSNSEGPPEPDQNPIDKPPEPEPEPSSEMLKKKKKKKRERVWKNKRGQGHTTNPHSDSDSLSESGTGSNGDVSDDDDNQDREEERKPVQTSHRKLTPSLPEGQVLGQELQEQLNGMEVQQRRERMGKLARMAPYEFQRECNIARKDEMLKCLGIPDGFQLRKISE